MTETTLPKVPALVHADELVPALLPLLNLLGLQDPICHLDFISIDGEWIDFGIHFGEGNRAEARLKVAIQA